MDSTSDDDPQHNRAAALPNKSSLGIVLPKRVRDTVKRHKHTSDIFNELNAYYFYKRTKLEAKEREQALALQVERAKRALESLQKHESEFPSNKFNGYAKKTPDDPDIKGSIQLPGQQQLVAVVGFVLRVHTERKTCLLVLRDAESKSCSEYFSVICDVSRLPGDTVKKYKKGMPLKKFDEWLDIDVTAVRVRRGNEQLHFLTSGPFRNRTCDSFMLKSLKNGLVVKRLLQKPEFLVYRLPFWKGTVKSVSEVYTVTGTPMCLTHPTRTSEIPRQILSLAKEAKHLLIKNETGSQLFSKQDSVSAILADMESFSSNADELMRSERYQCLNFALGGNPSFGEYGRFIPCSVALKANPFPNNSFQATPCSCDLKLVEQPSGDIDGLKRQFGKMYGPNQGHNAPNKRKKS